MILVNLLSANNKEIGSKSGKHIGRTKESSASPKKLHDYKKNDKSLNLCYKIGKFYNNLSTVAKYTYMGVYQ